MTCPKCLKARNLLEQLVETEGSLVTFSEIKEVSIIGTGKHGEQIVMSGPVGKFIFQLGEIYRKEESGG